MKIAVSHTSESLDFIDALLPDLEKIMIPFFSPSVKNPKGADGFGSGFLATYNGRRYLVTALHVVEDVAHYGTCVIRINGKAIFLEKVKFSINKDNDLAFALIDDLLNRNNINDAVFIDLDFSADTDTVKIDHHLLLGYPETKNRIDPKWNKTAILLLSITANPANPALKIKTPILKRILFEYNTKKLINSDLTIANQPPKLQGMSGGPSLEMRVARFAKDKLEVSILVSGVLVEWHKNEKIVVAASVDSLRTAMDLAV